MKFKLILLVLLFPVISFAQKTIVEGVVLDGLSGEPMPFVTVRYQDAKIGTITDTLGHYSIDTYYATDSLIFSYSGYVRKTIAVELEISQVLNITLEILQTDVQEVYVKAPDELPSTRLHKKVIKHKDANNKVKLESYEYELYNKVQIDINNISEKLMERGIVKKLDLVMGYLDSAENGTSYLPVILSETVSDFYYTNSPKKKKEVVKASRISGVENLELNQFLGDMYLNINIYDNYINLFNKSFVSPVANFARTFYRFYLEDSTFIDNQWCYKLTFKPKNEGFMTFEGEMWIHDTTYAVKSFVADISPWANINYVQGLHIEHYFNMVADEVWMLTDENMIADLKITKKTKVNGFFGRKHATRTNFIINEARPPDFYKTNSTVEFEEGANSRSDEYWAKVRHEPLSIQEEGIDQMIDSLNDLRFFKNLRRVLYMATTGYFPAKKIEIGNVFSLFGVNPVEKYRVALALRTSNSFSKRVELGGKIAYGFGDEIFKYGGSIRFNVSPKKRGMLTTFYNFDIEQIGNSSNAASVGSTFATILRTGPLDKLTFVKKAGMNLEKDIGKDVIIFGGFTWKEYKALGAINNYVRIDPLTGFNDTITTIQTSEFVARFRWGKDEEFISGYFNRVSTGSRYPIFSIQGTFGVKDFLGGDYDYQKIDFFIEHTRNIGVLGRIKYNVNLGYIIGTAAYPFLKVHEGNQSYWLMTDAFNKMDYFEFISDRYVTALLENHWDGLFLDRLRFMKKLSLRLVTTARIAFGEIDDRHQSEMLIPEYTKDFKNTPYVEVAIGIENILTVGRVDVFWRLTHTDPALKVTDLTNFGIRARYAINF